MTSVPAQSTSIKDICTYQHSLLELCVVPCIDLSWTSNVGGIGEHCLQFRHQRTVGAILAASCQDSGQIEEFCSLGQAQNVVPELSDLPVSHELQQARLVVHKQNRCVLEGETVVAGLVCGNLAGLQIRIRRLLHGEGVHQRREDLLDEQEKSTRRRCVQHQTF